MRYREKANSLATTDYPGWWTETRNGINFPWIDQILTGQQYVAMLDVVTPNWRKLIATGHIINNPMASVTFAYQQVPASILVTGHMQGLPSNEFSFKRTTGCSPASNATVLMWGELDVDLEQYSRERDVALSKAWANVDVSSIQAMASLGELPETVHWMVSLTQRMISVYRAFAAKKLLAKTSKVFRSGRSVVDAMSDIWLELRYAVRPLIMDMASAVEAWNAVLNKSDRFTARGFERIELSTSTSTYSLGPHIVSRVSTVEANFRAGVLFTVGSDVNELCSIWGLDQPIETIWELLPFSFIVDWFFSVGHTISAWTINPGLHPLSSWSVETIITKVTDSLPSMVNEVDPNTWVIEGEQRTAGTSTTLHTVKRRIVAPERSVIPQFELNLNTAKLIDLAAIGRKLFFH